MTVREAVARYLTQGFRPLPMWGVDDRGECRCGGIDPRTRKPCNAGKHSRDEDSWKNGREYRPEDFSEQDNVALALGPWKPGKWLVCLDFDGGPVPLTMRAPPTLEQRSPRGFHQFYWVPEYEPLGNWVDCWATKWTRGWSCDVRYARGRINVEPSRSAHGRYEWANDREPAELPHGFLQRLYRERRARGLPVLSRWEREGKRP